MLAGSGIGVSADTVSRVIQGVATGIGFIGAGTILKLQREHFAGRIEDAMEKRVG